MAGLTRLAPFFGIIGLIAAWSIYAFIKKQPNSNNRLQQLEQTLNNGVMAFLVKEYSMLALFAAAVFIILWLTLKEWQTSLAFVSGALCSVVACYSGMTAILNSNSKILETANRSELVKARNEAFLSASVMGLTVAGLGLLGVGIWFFIYGSDALMIRRITGFALGASSAALFARLSGGIFSRAASFGTEIACRMEAGIPYNSPQNPGVIARSAATSIVDIAGMGADLFESFAGSVIAAIFIGATFSVSSDIITLFPDLKPVSIEEAINIIRLKYMALPVLIIIAGLLSSIAALFSIKISRGTDSFRMHRYAVLSAAGVFLIISAAIITAFGMPFGTFWALFSGLVCGIAAGFSAGYYTSGERAGYIAAHSKTGAAAVIMAGLSAGMLSTYIPAACICAATLTGYMASGAYGTALAAVGMIATIGINMTVHGFSPVARNAQTMSEMAGLSPETASIAKQLDSPEKGGSSAGKVFASVSAALTALALFYAFVQSIQVSHPETPEPVFDIKNPIVITGFFIGALLPMLWAALTIISSGRASLSADKEIRRQFMEIPGLLEGRTGAEGDPKAFISLTASAALKEMLIPCLIAIITPIAVGFVLGPAALGSTVFGTVIMGSFLALFMSNAGDVWENAKKHIETGRAGGKGSDNHKATIVGHAVGGLIRNTCAPAINILIKLISVIALVIAPVLPATGLFF